MTEADNPFARAMTNEEAKAETIELDGPELLEWEQHFFDQPPFRELLGDDYENNGLTLGLYIASRYKTDPFRLSTDDRVELRNLARNYGHLIPKGDDRPFLGRFNELIKILNLYPEWRQYIKAKMVTATYYRADGSFKAIGLQEQRRASYDAAPTVTYANWITEQLRIQHKIIALGIDEVFPSQLASPVPLHPNQTGHKPGWRKWRILRAAEITRPK